MAKKKIIIYKILRARARSLLFAQVIPKELSFSP